MPTTFDMSPEPDYTISFATIEGGFQEPVLLGVEIQPPLDTLAAKGLAKALTANSSREAQDGGGPLAGEAYVTRNDERGTAFAIYRSDTTSRGVVDYIAKVINPIGALKVEVNAHDHKVSLRRKS